MAHMAHMEFEEKRYCVEAVFVINEEKDATATYRHFFDNFFDAAERAKRYATSRLDPVDVNIFDYAAGRTLFDLADLD